MFNFDADQFMQLENDETMPEIEADTLSDFDADNYLKSLDDTF